MNSSPHLPIAFFIDRFDVPSPSQQLLDRFLTGYTDRDGFVKPSRAVRVVYEGSAVPSGLAQRQKEFGLEIASSIPDASRDAAAVVIAISESNQTPVGTILRELPPGTRVFRYGRATADDESGLMRIAAQKQIAFESGTTAGHLFALPEIPLPIHGKATRAVMIVQGEFPNAESDALEALASVLNSTAEHVRKATPLKGPALWATAYSEEWLPLFRAAASRSNTIKGDPERDGRPQDIVGLRLIEKLAVKARGWILEHETGSQSLLLVVGGAMADMNFAVESPGGRIVSAQLYRPPSPMQEEFSNLAAALERFFGSKEKPSQAFLWVGKTLQQMQLASAKE